MWIGYPTPLGEGWIEWEGSAIRRLGLPGTVPPGERRFRGAEPEWVRDLAVGLARYFAGLDRLPGVPAEVLPPTTRYREAVHRTVRAIEHGTTATYGEVARRVGRPGTARAVGAAMAHNPIAPLVPCHRVVGSDGSLRGYVGGIDMKQWLIDMEADRA